MKRRDFIWLAGAAAVPLPLRTHAQPATPVVGFLHSRGPDDAAHLAVAFRSGLSEAGFTEGRNVRIEYRWARGRYDRLASLAQELCRIPVAALAAGGGEPTVLAAANATSTIPIVFAMSGDPIKLGLADSINRPGRNITGVNTLTATLEPKRLGLLHDLVPAADTIGMLVNRDFPPAEHQIGDAERAARSIGVRMLPMRASNEADIDAAFEAFAGQHIRALTVASSPYFDTVRKKIIAHAAALAVPTMYHFREYAADGGLISYSISITDATRQMGRYIGEILKGAKPGDLPIVSPTKFDLVINLKTAKALKLAIPSGLLAIADEVIE